MRIWFSLEERVCFQFVLGNQHFFVVGWYWSSSFFGILYLWMCSFFFFFVVHPCHQDCDVVFLLSFYNLLELL